MDKQLDIVENGSPKEFKAYIENLTGKIFSDKVSEIAFHKARHGHRLVTPDKRLASKRWLIEHGYGGIYGERLRNPDKLDF